MKRKTREALLARRAGESLNGWANGRKAMSSLWEDSS